MTCPFCANLSSLDIVYANDIAAVALHEDWAVLGHAMVIAKEHVENLSELAAPERFMRVYREAERALLRLTGAQRAVIMKFGIVTPHLHLHVYPVSAGLDRASVMNIIEARVHIERDAAFVDAVREALDRALRAE